MPEHDPDVPDDVGIVGGGPAGLMLAHLLGIAGIESVVVDNRTRREIEETHRAGILEQDSVRLLVETGVSDRVLRDGYRHEGIELGFGGELHRIDFEDLVGAAVQLYPQTDVFIDLADARERDGGDVRFGVQRRRGRTTSSREPRRSRSPMPTADAQEVRCDYLVGADGSRSMCRHEFPESKRRQYSREYPFAWFGILCEAPPSAPELIYNHSDRGFALISQRTETLQRMYFQCDPDEDVDDWSDDRIWEELQARVGANGSHAEGGADHLEVGAAVPQLRPGADAPRPTAAGRRRRPHRPADRRQGPQPRAGRREGARRGARARDLAEGRRSRSTTTPTRALGRVWKAQHFSYWMTTMLHRPPRRQPLRRTPPDR